MFKAYMFLFLAIILEIIATSSLQASKQFSKLLPTTSLIIAYCSSFYCLSLSLKTIPVGIAYAIWSGLGIVLISLIGWVVFKQKLDLPAILGLSFIIVGVIIINVFSKFKA